jgi:hypothetical protein
MALEERFMRKHGKIEVGIRESRKGKKDRFRYIFEFCTTLAVLSVLVALGILVWQLYTLSTTGAWQAVRLFDALSFVGIDLQGVYFPRETTDLARYGQLLLELPATLMLPLLTFLLSGIIALFTRSGRN